jgi:hypothetical protein
MDINIQLHLEYQLRELHTTFTGSRTIALPLAIVFFSLTRSSKLYTVSTSFKGLNNRMKLIGGKILLF